MLVEWFNKYVDEMKSIRLTMEVLSKEIPKKINEEVQKYQIAALIDLYFHGIVDGKDHEKLRQEIEKYVEIIEVSKEERKIGYIVKDVRGKRKEEIDPETFRNKLEKYYNTIETMYDNLLISIMIKFENIMSELFAKILSEYTGQYLNGLSIDYNEIVKVESIEELQKKLIKKEVEKIMHENVFEWVKLLNKNKNVNIGFENELSRKFVEAYYRRNIIVHNNGKVNAEYIKGLSQVNKEMKNITLETKLVCTEEYMGEIINASIFVIFYFIERILNLFPEELEEFTEEIFAYGLDLIMIEEYELAKQIFKVMKNNKNLSFQYQIYSKINYWQTYKWSGAYDDIEEEVNGFDFSACEDIIKLAILSLQDKYSEAFDLINKILGKNNNDTDLAECLEEWPVYKNIRQQEEYNLLREKYKKLFNSRHMIQGENENSRSKEVLEEEDGTFKIKIDFKKKPKED